MKREQEYFLIAISVFLIFLFQCGIVSAFKKETPRGPVNIEADSLSYDSKEDAYKAEGSVVINFSGGYLKADNVTFYKEKTEALAEGHVVIKSDGDLMEGEKVRFNITDKTGIVYDGMLFFDRNHLYLRGKEIEKRGDDTYYLKDARVTTCDGDNPDWSLAGKEIGITINGYGTLKHGTFQVRNYPLLYVPYMIFPAKTKRQTGFLLPSFGFSRDKLGTDIVLPFYWAISENTDATFYQRYMDKRGFQEGVEFRYCISEDSSGTFYVDYLSDIAEISEEGEDDLGRQWEGSQKRWSYYLNHETIFSPGFYLRTDINKVSDIWYFKDFSTYNYYLKNYADNAEGRFRGVYYLGDKSLPYLDSKARLVKDWELFNLTTLVQYTDNFQSPSNDETLQRYPEITFTGIKQPIFNSPVNFELTTSYDYLDRITGSRGSLVDAFPIISLPINFGYYFQLTPEIGVRETVWDISNTEGSMEEEHGAREVYNIGATLSTELQRIFLIGGKTVDKIRHVIEPEVRYAYIPYVFQEDLPDFVDEIGEGSTIAYSLTNTVMASLKGKDGELITRQLMRLKLSQLYDIKEARRNLADSAEERRPFSPVRIEFDVDPLRYLYADTDATFDVNDGEWKELNAAVGIGDWRGDSIKTEYRYTQDSVEEFNIYLMARVMKSLDLMYTYKKNILDREKLETTYGMIYRRQCWNVKLEYSELDDDTRYMVVFSLYGLGGIGN